MNIPFRTRTLLPLAAGLLLGLGLSGTWNGSAARVGTQAHAGDAKKAPTLDSLAAELETVKGRLPDQSHAMSDVGYHFTNLWFAADMQNWPLADFYFKETKAHLNWAVRIIPLRKDAAGREIDLRAILQSIENGPFKQLEAAIVAQDQAGFVKAYNFTIEGCYACHKASNKPFLRPQVPTRPDAHIINFDPNANWPK